ncbi:MAG: DUF4286 family protein [Phycisphaeraceae bacterium]|nr:DUF4286 family protein [Phycisphaeraceae bacterium]
MSAIAYTVLATFPDEPTAREYIDWLLGGHIGAVLRGGASSAQIIRNQSEPIQVEIRYLFPNQQVFDRYVAEVAPGLRADGIRRFPPERGIRMERRSGVILNQHQSRLDASPSR